MINLLHNLVTRERQIRDNNINKQIYKNIQIGDTISVSMLVSKQSKRKDKFTGTCTHILNINKEPVLILHNDIYKEKIIKRVPTCSSLVKSIDIIQKVKKR
jgi:ribosomal protein L19